MLKENEIQELKELYLYSNTPLFLYESFRKADVIKALSKKDFSELKTTFVTKGNEGVETIEQLVLLYAIYTAMTFKNYQEASTFFNNEGDIKFEWFTDIKEIFFARNKPTINESIKINRSPIKLPHTRLQSGKFNDSIQEINL